jgi:hypothetical protein
MEPRSVSTPPTPEDVETIISRAQRAKAEADESRRQEQAEAKRRKAALLDAHNYVLSLGRGADPSNWVDILYRILKTAGPFIPGEILPQIPARGMARQVLVHVCGLIQGDGDQKRQDAATPHRRECLFFVRGKSVARAAGVRLPCTGALRREPGGWPTIVFTL